jgi:sigma-E factor negative regulatory protein RseB
VKGYLATFGVLLSLLPAQANAQVCSSDEREVLALLDRVVHGTTKPNFAARALVQTAVGSQQIIVSHGPSGQQSGYSVKVPTHNAQCPDKSHQLLLTANEGCGVAQWYKLDMRSETAGGRETQIITAIPRDFYRHGFQLVVDQKTQIVLRSTTFTQGNALENIELQSLSVSTAASVSDTVEDNPAGLNVSPAADFGWSPSWIPSGFLQSAGTIGVIDTQTFTDGLSSFSIFVERPEGDIRKGEGRVSRGATVSYVRGMNSPIGPRLVTVVGEIPVNTARMVVEGIDWSRDAQ